MFHILHIYVLETNQISSRTVLLGGVHVQLVLGVVSVGGGVVTGEVTEGVLSPPI